MAASGFRTPGGFGSIPALHMVFRVWVEGLQAKLEAHQSLEDLFELFIKIQV